mgnify:CR=1 FL=1
MIRKVWVLKTIGGDWVYDRRDGKTIIPRYLSKAGAIRDNDWLGSVHSKGRYKVVRVLRSKALKKQKLFQKWDRERGRK